MTETTPEGSAGQPQARAEAERPMHRHDEADAGEGRSPVGGLPDREQGAGEKDDPTDHGNGDNRELNPEDAVLNEPVTRAERFAFWTLVATAGLAFATFVLAIATADMARSTRQLAGFAKQQAHDTQDALDAARRQALAAETANKLVNAPQVSVSTVTLNVPNQDAKNTAHGLGGPIPENAHKVEIAPVEIDPLADAGRLPNPQQNLERSFLVVGGRQIPIAEFLEARFAEHEERLANQKRRLTALIEEKLPTNGHGEITAQRLRDTLEAIVEAL